MLRKSKAMASTGLKITALVTGMIGVTLLTGCGSNRPPVALAIVLDTSGSAWENRERGFQYLQTILQGGYLPKGSTLALVRCGRDSKIIWEGRVKENAEILAAYQETVQTEQKSGTDVVTSLTLSRDWLATQREQGIKQTILTGWTDLQADPAKEGSRVLRAFKPADTMTWPASKGVNVIFFGVPPEQAAPLKKRWQMSLASVTPYSPAHRIRPEDLGLTKGAAF